MTKAKAKNPVRPLRSAAEALKNPVLSKGDKEYRGYVIKRGRTYQDWQVYFPDVKRARWGTLTELKDDIDAHLDSALPPKGKASPVGKRVSNPAHSPATLQAAKLYQKFTGHDPEVIGRVTIPALPKSAARIGECDGILYTTVRDGVTERYIHKFRKADKPMFCVSPDGKQLLLVGGNYDFTERGIVDHSDPSA